MLKNKFVIATVMSLLVVVVVYRIFNSNVGGGKGAVATSSSVPSERPSLPSSVAEARITEGAEGEVQAIGDRVSYRGNGDWGRNPFLTLEELRGEVSTQPPKEMMVPSEEALKVNSILITESRRRATINHRVVSEGDWIDGEQVLKITSEGVLLGKGKQQRMITLAQSSIPLIVRER